MSLSLNLSCVSLQLVPCKLVNDCLKGQILHDEIILYLVHNMFD